MLPTKRVRGVLRCPNEEKNASTATKNLSGLNIVELITAHSKLRNDGTVAADRHPKTGSGVNAI